MKDTGRADFIANQAKLLAERNTQTTPERPVEARTAKKKPKVGKDTTKSSLEAPDAP
jgi:hypothetical protein